MMTLVEPTFLYPQSRQFPFDEICEMIVRALERRNWDVPGLTVKFGVYGSGEAHYRRVSSIAGPDFQLKFGRGGEDRAAVATLSIPQKRLDVYDDACSPSFYPYQGRNWDQDKERFEANIKAHRAAKKTLGAYNPETVFAEFGHWLKDHVLAFILAQPEPAGLIDVFHREPTSFAADLGPFFCFGSNSDAYRVRDGRLDRSQLEPRDRYGLAAGGRRLMVVSAPPGSELSPDAYQSFRWCGFGDPAAPEMADQLEIPGEYRGSHDRYLFRVTPNRADGIFVVDNAPFVRRHAELFREVGPHGRLSEAQLGQAELARARTMVPITDYPGHFAQPVLLVERELDLDEVELVSGPDPEFRYVKIIFDHNPEARRLIRRAIEAHGRYHASSDRAWWPAYEVAVVECVDYLAADEELARLTRVNQRIVGRMLEAAIEAHDFGLLAV